MPASARVLAVLFVGLGCAPSGPLELDELPPSCAAPLAGDSLYDEPREIAVVNDLLASLCACAGRDRTQDFELEVDTGHNARTMVLHRFVGGAAARDCFVDEVGAYDPPTRLRTRFRLGPTPLGIGALMADVEENNSTDTRPRNDTDGCFEHIPVGGYPPCEHLIEYDITSLAYGGGNTAGTGMFTLESRSRTCAVRRMASWRPAPLWRYEWSIEPLGRYC